MKTLIPGTMQRGPAWCWTSVALVALAAAGLPAASAAAATQAGGRASHRPAPVGTAYSWGNNAAGELGQGSHANSVVPKRVLRLPVNSIKAVSAGTDASLALTRIGAVQAWGDNSQGQLGTGNQRASTTPVAVKQPRRPRAAHRDHGHRLGQRGQRGTGHAWERRHLGQQHLGPDRQRPT